jgi:chemotaxis protein methyltransferase CheR
MIDLICRMAEEQYGIKADPDDAKRLEKYILNNSVEKGTSTECTSTESTKFLESVFSSGAAAEFLTINETYFFREPVHYALLLELLPSFGNSGIRICSAAAAAGCEAYSIAMLIESYNNGIEKPVSYHIDAFDINAQAIETARKGVYSSNAIREDGSRFRYMMIPYLKESNNKFHIVDSIKKNINFFTHNLMDELFIEQYDIIFFRNAFIYFLPHKRQLLLSNLSNILKKGGILIPGVSETAAIQHVNLIQENRRFPPFFNDVFYFLKSATPPPAIS